MAYKNDTNDKREEAISACLDQFCKKGLYETTSRDLSRALKLQAGGMYSYFSNKDEAVLLCAEEAAFLLEKYLVNQAIANVSDVDLMFNELLDRAEKLSHMMKFFAQVCSVPKYKEGMDPILKRLTQRHKSYAEQLAETLNRPTEEIEPIFLLCVSSFENYMLFGEKDTVLSQVAFIKSILIKN